MLRGSTHDVSNGATHRKTTESSYCMSFSTPYTTYVVLEHLGDCSKCVVNYAVTLLISTLISAKYSHSAIAKRHTAQTNATAPHRKEALLHGPLYYKVSNGATRRLAKLEYAL